MLQLASLSLASASLLLPTLCALQHLSFSQNWSYVSSRPYPGHIHWGTCTTQGAQNKVGHSHSTLENQGTNERWYPAAERETTRIDLGYSNMTLLVKIWAQVYLIWVNQVKHERSDVVDEFFASSLGLYLGSMVANNFSKSTYRSSMTDLQINRVRGCVRSCARIHQWLPQLLSRMWVMSRQVVPKCGSTKVQLPRSLR